MITLGFDPGGARQFGWCVAEATPEGQLHLHRSGVADHAFGAVRGALEAAQGNAGVEAAGIDSPLFWVTGGSRRADRTIRSAMSRRGAPNVSGTVQAVNSLQGACVAQGVMAAYLLRKELPGIRITESHPKALLWLASVATIERPVAKVTMPDLAGLITCGALQLSDHERDAALSAVAAWAMVTECSGWRDLSRDEPDAYAPVSPVEYWMPITERVG